MIISGLAYDLKVKYELECRYGMWQTLRIFPQKLRKNQKS